MSFKKIETGIPGLSLIQPDVFGDVRGWFMESWNQEEFKKAGLDLNFVQDNVSRSQKGTLRGMHFQIPPFAQGKLVYVLSGSVLDVAVDIRKGSPTYGKYFSAEINDENHKMLFIPEGCAHGFLVLSDSCLFAYKCTSKYHHDAEGGLIWNDPEIGIPWNIQNPLLSDRDKQHPTLKNFNSPFTFQS